MSCDVSEAIELPSIELPPSHHKDDLLYGVLIRPPVFKLLNGQFICSRLVEVDESSISQLSGIVKVVVRGNFVGIVAKEYSQALSASRQLKVVWKEPGSLNSEPLDSPVNNDIAEISQGFQREYRWPNRFSWGNESAWVIASSNESVVTVHTQSTAPKVLRQELAALVGLTPEQISLSSADREISFGRDCNDDAAADALLLSHGVNRPVAVLLSPDYQNVCHALGFAQQIDLEGRTKEGKIHDLRYRRHRVSDTAPVLALLLTNPAFNSPLNEQSYSKDSPYHFDTETLISPTSTDTAYQVADFARAQDTFARETWMDEVSDYLDEDPVALRQAHIHDERGLELINSVTDQSGWQLDQRHGLPSSAHEDVAVGRGFAYTHRTSDEITGSDRQAESGTRSAWVVDIKLNKLSGEVTVDRLVVGQDSGLALDQDALKQKLHRDLLSEQQPQLLTKGWLCSVGF